MISEAQQISEAVVAVFQAWRQAGIPFLVLRNYDSLPEKTTNDIDVLVPEGQGGRAEAALREAAAAQGFRWHNHGKFATSAFYFSHRDSGAQVHFDLFTDLKWHPFIYLETSGFLDRRQERGTFFVPDKVDEAAANLLSYLVYAGRVKEKYRGSISSGFQVDADRAVALMSPTLGPKLAQTLTELGKAERWEEIGDLAAAVRRTLLVRNVILHPLRTTISIARTLSRYLHRFVHPPGVVLVLCGADGCGKSTVAALLTELMARTFSPDKGTHLHWKPPVFSKKRHEGRAPVTDPHAKPPRGAVASLAFFAVHWLEFFLGYWLRVRPVTFRGGMVLIDRHYYDFFVDQRRYRLKVPMWLVRFGYVLLPKPDLVFALDAPLEVLRSRKQEVAVEETARQREAYASLVRGLRNGRVIDATQSPAKVAGVIRQAVFDYLEKRLNLR